MPRQGDRIQERVNADGSITFKAQLRIRGFEPKYRSFKRKTDAKAWLRAEETAIRSGRALSSEAERTTFKEALERYLREVTPTKKDREREERRINFWMKHPLAARFLSQLRGEDFAKYRDERLASGKAWSTVRLDLALISSLYKRASREWKMEGLRNPIKNVTMPSAKTHGSNTRDRRLVGDEEARLLAALGAHGPYFAPLAELAIESAMRQGELLALTWGDVDLERRVAKLRDTKNSEARDVPLSTRAVEIIRALPRPIDSKAPLFPLDQQKVIRTFRQACIDAKLEDLKFHDLRHEATSRICQRMAMHEAMRVTGHKTPAMLMRYYHPKAEDLARKLA